MVLYKFKDSMSLTNIQIEALDSFQLKGFYSKKHQNQ